MAKLPKLQHVKYVRSKGKLYAYFNTGKRDNLAPPSTRVSRIHPTPSSSIAMRR